MKKSCAHAAESSLRTRSRAVVLMAVMISVAMIASAASIVLLRADAHVTGTAAVLRHSQSRAAALSGVRAALAELTNQRAKLLQGGSPEITGSWTLADAGQGTGLSIRLLDLGPTEGVLFQPEAAKINLNAASIESMTAASDLLGFAGERLSAMRARGAIGSLSELGRAGVSPDRVYGRVLSPDAGSTTTPAMAGAMNAAASPAATGSLANGSGGSSTSGQPATGNGAMAIPGGSTALADVCTVFSADPNVQVGISGAGTTYGGMARINLGLGWSEELVEPITKRFGKDAVETTRQLLQNGGEIKSMKDVVGVLRRLGVPNRQWGSLLDAFTTSADPYIIGRVDLLRAPAGVLATIPGIDLAAAERIVAVRDRLDESARREVTWPVLEGILSVEQFELAVDSLTCRTMQWRIIVEAGRPRRLQSGATTAGVHDLTDRVVLEAVLDVAGAQPRIAYLRDVSSLQAVRSIHAARREATSATQGDAGASAGSFAEPSTGMMDEQIDAGLMEPSMNDLDLWGGEMTGDDGQEMMQSTMDQLMDESNGETAGRATGAAVNARGVDNRTGRWNAQRSTGGTP
jgi:hypothetical protein